MNILRTLYIYLRTIVVRSGRVLLLVFAICNRRFRYTYNRENEIEIASSAIYDRYNTYVLYCTVFTHRRRKVFRQQIYRHVCIGVRINVFVRRFPVLIYTRIYNLYSYLYVYIGTHKIA